MATSSMADHVGRVLGGRYRLLTPIGTGASAQVFLAEDVTLRRQVAVKVLHPALAEDDSFLRRFRAEAQQAAALNHPNAMRVFDWGESPDGPFLVLEHLGGGSLRDMLDAGHLLSPSQALLVGLEAARGLDYAHRRGLVHRDIKPANLLFDDEGRLCIADFGLARALAEAAWTEPAGAILGTARYASPEQAQGLSVDGKADVYSLALVLVEAVTGRVPFSADTTIATLMARVNARLEPAAALGPLGPVVVEATAPEPSERLDARQLVDGLERAARELPAPGGLPLRQRSSPDATLVLPGPASDITELGVVPRPSDDEAEAPAGGGDLLLPAARRRRRWWPWAVLALFVLLLGVVSAYAISEARIPKHPVPSLRGKTVAEARSEVADEKFRIKLGEARFDEAVAPDHVVEQDPSPLASRREGESVTVVLSKGPQPRGVPDLTGTDQTTAEQRLKDAGFVPKAVAQPDEEKVKGVVLAWSPTGVLPKGSEIVLTVSSGPAPREIPDVTGKTYDEAAAALTAAGLKPQQADVFSSDVDKGLVVSTKPGVGRAVDRDSVVTVNVSKGPDTVPVPDVTGKSVAEATAALQAAGLQVSGTGGRPHGQTVFLTDPVAGVKVARNTGVFLYVR
ncbi:MAG TPA: PASTA domain-containing protein [Acidimicrobiales bacterium]|nr:PASTA domain-containing protein [Acidimicrobiales bacterium]